MACSTPFRTMRCAERGQMTVLSTLMLVALLGAAALIVDGGHWLHERRAAQGVADSAALAAVRELATGGSPEAVAQEYVDRNGQESMNLESVVVNGGEVTVTVERTSQSFLASVLGIVQADISADSTAWAAQPMGGIAGSLPFAFMRDGYDLDSNEGIKVETNLGPGNRGTISLPMEPSCELGSGANDLRGAINYGACPAPIGSEIETQTGNTWGPIRQALDQRIGDNVQSFDDVFLWDGSTGRYVVRDVDSPRLGVVPVIENPDGTTTWPGGDSPIIVVDYLLVYIGKTDASPYPAYTGNKTVWVTPVRAILPEELDALLSGELDPSNDSPVSFRLVD